MMPGYLSGGRGFEPTREQIVELLRKCSNVDPTEYRNVHYARQFGQTSQQ